jgi:predicted nucleic acid-binding protein
MRVALDVNVILDVLLQRDPWCVESNLVWEANRSGAIDAAVVGVTLPTIFYVVRKAADREQAWRSVADCLEAMEVLPVERADLEAALAGPSADDEDNLQHACAARAGVDALVTRDPSGFAGASLPVLSPAELLARLAAP